MAKVLKLKARKFYGIIPTFVEVAEEKLVEGGGGWGGGGVGKEKGRIFLPPILNRDKTGKEKP